MARIAGVDIPREKRLEISLTYIYGVGRTTRAAGVRPGRACRPTRGPRPHRRRGRPLRGFIDQNLKVEGDLRREVAPEHQAQDGDRQLPGTAPPPRASRCAVSAPVPTPAPARARRRPSPARSAPASNASQPTHESRQNEWQSQSRGPTPEAQRAQERHLRRRAHQVVVQQHDRHDHRPAGQHARRGRRRATSASRARASRRRSRRSSRPKPRRRRAMEHGVRKVDVVVKGPGSGARPRSARIQNAGIEVVGIKDVTPIPHNGCRPPKRRRV